METFNATQFLLDRQVAAGRGNHPALLGPGGSCSYAELDAEVAAVAAGLRAIGIRPEERVLACSTDRPELLTLLLATMRIGAIAVPVSTMYRDTELAELLEDARPTAVFASAETAQAVRAAIARTARLPRLLRTDDARAAEDSEVSWSQLRAAGAGGNGGVHDTWTESPALWLYTSGTTGTPKAAMHRHGSIRAVAENYGARVLGIRPDDVCFSVAKLFFAYGLGNSALFPLSVGATTLLDPARPTPAAAFEVLAEHRPTLFFGVPTFYAALLAADLPGDAFASVRLAVSAGEPLPAPLAHRFTERFGVEIIDGIGSTEALHIFLSNAPGAIRPGTTGRPVPGYDLRLRGDDDAPVPPGTPGHLQIRGESLCTGYWCRTATTRAAFDGEWLRTGDTYVVDEDGWWSCLGRSNDMIKAGGIWVSPGEVEAVLLAHPGVAAVAVVAVPDADGLDKPVAVVVPVPGAAPQAAELIACCRVALAAFKRPRHVLFVEALPTTATGKVRRFQVREHAIAVLAGASDP